MQKFGIFDVIDKIAPAEKLFKAFLGGNKERKEQLNENLLNDSNSTKTVQTIKRNNVLKNDKKSNINSFLSMIKKHDEISKRIDQNNK